MNEIRLNRDEVNVDHIFTHNKALYVRNEKEDHESMSIKDYRQ